MVDLASEEAMHVQAKLDVAKERAGNRHTGKTKQAPRSMGRANRLDNRATLPDPPKNEIRTSGLESRAIEQRLDPCGVASEALGQAHFFILGFARVQAVGQQFEIGGRYVHEIQGEHSTGPIIRIPIPLFNFGQGVKHEAKQSCVNFNSAIWTAVEDSQCFVSRVTEC